MKPAQSGDHAITKGKQRSTYGHSLVVAPWGEVLLDGGEEVGIHLVDLDMDRVDQARRRIASLSHDREYTLAT